jgi:hypothetical protein
LDSGADFDAPVSHAVPRAHGLAHQVAAAVVVAAVGVIRISAAVVPEAESAAKATATKASAVEAATMEAATAMTATAAMAATAAARQRRRRRHGAQSGHRTNGQHYLPQHLAYSIRDKSHPIAIRFARAIVANSGIDSA